ncbi:MAG: hypothetical protein FWC45_02070 [Treponema sp.]|nr:hypothetical protein [Treponema sp.]
MFFKVTESAAAPFSHPLEEAISNAAFSAAVPESSAGNSSAASNIKRAAAAAVTASVFIRVSISVAVWA